MNTKISSRYFLFLMLFSAFLFFGILTYWLELSKEEISNRFLNIRTEPLPLTIILSPHFDDAALSLGGLMAKNRRGKLLVATFFAGKPIVKMHAEWDRRSGFIDSDEAILAREKENEAALAPLGAIIRNYNYLDFQYRGKKQDRAVEESIVRDIESIISNYGAGRQIFMYGPAVFNREITHPDHEILHNAFLKVSQRHRQESNIKFFIYEDFPYIHQFIAAGFGELGSYLENIYNLKFEETPIKLTEPELSEKIASISKYSSQMAAMRSVDGGIEELAGEFYKSRCREILPQVDACEIAYKVIQNINK